MKMSDGERLIVVMLAEVMQGMKLNGKVDPALVETLACNGDDWAIKRMYSGFFKNEPGTLEQVTETANILWMWEIIEHSLAELTDAEADEAKGWHGTQFQGFDGNNDDHYGIAITLINKLGEFDSFKGHTLNSHSMTSLPHYQAMYEKFDKYRHAQPLSLDALRDVFNQ